MCDYCGCRRSGPTAKEEVGLFVHAKTSTPLGDQIDALCKEHDDRGQSALGG